MRPDIHTYCMKLAEMAADRSTCDRRHVGSVIVVDKSVVSTGYNGSVRGADHCDDIGHLMIDGHCVRTIHSEANAIVQAAKNGININDSTMYVTDRPCWNCFKLIVNAGIRTVYYARHYDDPLVNKYMDPMTRIGDIHDTKIKLIHMKSYQIGPAQVTK